MRSMPKLFVIMPFGRRAVAQVTNGVHDFDVVYNSVIKVAARQANWDVLRIDEVPEPGSITNSYLREIYAADLVLADITSHNANVFFELGIRQAISPNGALLIALVDTEIPFDLADLRVLFYSQDELTRPDRMVTQLSTALTNHRPSASSNPVRDFLERLSIAASPAVDPTAFERDLNGRTSRCSNADQLVAVWQWARSFTPLPASSLLSLSSRLATFGEYRVASEVLRRAASEAPGDYEVHRQFGFYLSKLGEDHEDEALAELQRADSLNPADPETLGMIGGILKRRREYAQAEAFYKRGSELAPSNLYMAVNRAAMGILLDPSSPRHGMDLYEQLLTTVAASPTLAGDTWAALVSAEAHFALGNDQAATDLVRQAVDSGAGAQDLTSVIGQIELLGAAGFRSEAATTFAGWIRTLGPMRRIVVADTSLDGSPQVKSAPPRLIVHLSDIHFGWMLRGGEEVDVHRFFDSENTDRLSTHIVNELAIQRDRLGIATNDVALIVSGDLTYRGEKAEYGRVAEFLDEVCTGVGLGRERVFLVPGNHDVNWHASTADITKRFDEYLSFLLEFYGDAEFRRRYPLVSWDFTVHTPRPRANQIIAVWRDEDTFFAGLNSCVYETHQDHYGFVGLRQLNHLAKLVDDYGAQAAVKVAVMHHHLHPFPEPLDSREASQVYVDLSTTRDAGLVERRLERLGFDIVLHGHKHKPQLRETYVRDRTQTQVREQPRRLIVSGSGSTGVDSREREHSQANQYTLLELRRGPRQEETEFVRVEWRELSEGVGAEWTTTQVWSIRG